MVSMRVSFLFDEDGDRLGGFYKNEWKQWKIIIYFQERAEKSRIHFYKITFPR